MNRSGIACILVLTLLSIDAQPALAGQHFTYAGIGLDLLSKDFTLILLQFPTSRIYGDTLSISKEDSHDHVYYVIRAVTKDRIGLRIGFEEPEEYLAKMRRSWAEDHRARHPYCTGVLETLVAQYGSPVGEQTSTDEALTYHVRTWYAGAETLKLHCYQLYGKGRELAEEITISKTNWE